MNKLKNGHFIGMVKDTSSEEWKERIIVDTLSEGCISVNVDDEEEYYENGAYDSVYWRRWKAATTRKMTCYELAMLPRGTAFINACDVEFYNPKITSPTLRSENASIESALITQWKGYRLPGETEIKPFITNEE